MKISLAGLCAFGVLLSGCTTPTHLLFHQTAIIGADVSANAASGQVSVSLGYDRNTTALVPKTATYETEAAVAGESPNEAMASVSASKVTIKGVGEYEVNEQFATGRAAVNLAQHPDDVVSLSIIRENEKPPPEQH